MKYSFSMYMLVTHSTNIKNNKIITYLAISSPERRVALTTDKYVHTIIKTDTKPNYTKRDIKSKRHYSGDVGGPVMSRQFPGMVQIMTVHQHTKPPTERPIAFRINNIHFTLSCSFNTLAPLIQH